MKTTKALKFYLFTLVIVWNTSLWAQKSGSDKRFQKVELHKFSPVSENPNYIYLPLGFNKSDFSKKLDKINPELIKSISLVYSQFRVSETFDQYTFNHERMHALYSQYPHLKSNKFIKWYWIGQTGCNSPEECKTFFHGFEIQFFSKEELEEAEIEKSMTDFYVNYYSNLMNSGEDALDSLSKVPNSGIYKFCDTTTLQLKKRKSSLGKVKATKAHEEKFAKLMNKNIKNGLKEYSIHYNKNLISPYYIKGVEISDSKKKYAIKKFKKYYRHTPSRLEGNVLPAEIKISVSSTNQVEIFYLNTDKDGEPIDINREMWSYHQEIKCNYVDSGRGLIVADSRRPPVVSSENVVMEVLNRNTQWKNCVVVADVTGSMYPYMGQFLAWHQLNLKNSKNHDFVFFNDGDNMLDSKKKTGSVGGLYFTSTKDYEKLKSIVNLAQNRGGGGDAEENDLEAVIFAINQKPNAPGIILIADNYAKPRDLELLSKIKTPIHVILCGANRGVNVAYLNLVRKNGGSLHTMEQDLQNLAKLAEGESITINNQVFNIKNGKFVLDIMATQTLKTKIESKSSTY
jgi:hypothetical protein